MRAVLAEETAAIGAQVLDGDLRGGRAFGHALGVHLLIHHHRLAVRAVHRVALVIRLGHLRHIGLHQRGGRIRLEILHHALARQRHRQNHRERQQHIQRAARDIHPEIAQRFDRRPAQTPRHRQQHRRARGRAQEVVHRQPRHLREITHRVLPGIRLPVRVRDETNGCVQGQRPRDIGELLRIKRQMRLRHLQRHQRKHPQHVENQHRPKKAPPGHLLVRRGAPQPVDQFFQRHQYRRKPRPLALEHPGHVAAQQRCERDQQSEVNSNLNQFIHVHEPTMRPPGKNV